MITLSDKEKGPWDPTSEKIAQCVLCGALRACNKLIHEILSKQINHIDGHLTVKFLLKKLDNLKMKPLS